MLQHGTGFGGRIVVRCCSMGLGLVDGLLLDQDFVGFSEILTRQTRNVLLWSSVC